MNLSGAITFASVAFLALLSALVFVARPGARLNRALAALLLLRATSDLFFQLYREAGYLPWSLEPLALPFRLGIWYDVPTVFFTVVVLDASFPRRDGRPRRALVAALGAVTGVVLLALALDPREFNRGLFPYSLGYVGLGAQVAAVVLGARVAADPTRTAVERKRAALIGLAFLLLVAHMGAGRLIGRVTLAFVGTEAPATEWAYAVLTALALPLLVIQAPRLARGFDGTAYRVTSVLAWSPFVLGVADAAYFAASLADLVPRGPFFPRPLFVAASAGCLAIAVVRYDLGGLGDRLRRRVALASQVVFVLAAVAIPATLVFAWLQGSSVGVAVAALAGLGALALSPTPPSVVGTSLARALLLDLDASEAQGERARLARASRVDQAAAPALLGRYTVERELGRGAFATAYLARDEATGGRVVLKRSHEQSLERGALDEARALAAVRHPRVVPLLAVERVGDEAFLVLGYAEGGTLAALAAREGPLPIDRAVALVLDALDGLAAVHAAGLAHGDVKLSNLLLDKEERVLVGDLGAARAFGSAHASATLTEAPVLGSLATAAPEVLSGARKSPAADLYSLGAVLYRLLTGEDYVDLAGLDIFAARQVVLHDAPRLPHPGVPPRIEAALARALAKDPKERFVDAREMSDALSEALQNGAGR